MWTTTSSTAANSQLGSLGLFASLSLLATSMIASVTQLREINNRCTEILRLKEIEINQLSRAYETDRHVPLHIGVTRGDIVSRRVKLRDFPVTWSVRNALGLLLFGPGYTLLPTATEQPAKAFKLAINVRDCEIVVQNGLERDSPDVYRRNRPKDVIGRFHVAPMFGLESLLHWRIARRQRLV
jgi:hypothetical protein